MNLEPHRPWANCWIFKLCCGIWWFSSSLLLSSPFKKSFHPMLINLSRSHSGPAAILAPNSAEHEQAFSELQSIAMAVTAQHQGSFQSIASCIDSWISSQIGPLV